MKTATLIFAVLAAGTVLGAELAPDRTVPYKETPQGELKLHIFNPDGLQKGQNRPAVVFFFGGGWTGGTPDHFYPQAAYLADRGMVAVCAEYRTKKGHGTDPRASVMDAKSALRWMRSKSKRLGIDPNRLAAGGGSAGGHLAAAAATLGKFSEPDEDPGVSCIPNALILFNPVYDNSENGYGYDRVKDYWEDFSPLHNIAKGMPPTIVFLGTEDKLVPVAAAEAFQAKMKANGDRSELLIYEGMPHGFFNQSKKNNKYAETVAEMDRFLVSLGWLEPKPE